MGVLTRLLIGVLALGGSLWGVGEIRLAGAASGSPARMTCKELGERGAAGNAHVVLTDFTLTNDLVYEHKKKTSDTSKWTKVWVPAVPSDSPYALAIGQRGADLSKIAAPRPVAVIVVSSDTRNEQELAALQAGKELDGMVVNLIHSLGHEEQQLLEQSYGDVSHAQIFEVGRKPASTVLALGAIVGGAAVGVAVVLSFFRKKRQGSPPPGP